MTGSMTEGKPLGLIIRFALPLLMGNILQQTYNVIDAAIVGRILGPEALAGVGASSSVQFFVLGFCMGICCGFGIPLAQAFGAGDMHKLRRLIFHAFLLTGAAAVIITTACALLCPNILHMLSTPDDIFADAYIYLLILFLGIPFSLLYNLLSAILRAVGDSRTPFIFLAISTVLNIILDLVFIICLGLGCAGAAAATITAQAVSGISCLVYINKKRPDLSLSADDRKFTPKYLGTMLVMGIPMGLQYSITAIGSMVMQSANNGLGSVYISGFTAGMRIKQFVMCPFDAVATAVSVFAGQNLGAGRIDRVKTGLAKGIAVNVGYGIASGLVLIFFGRALSGLFIEQGETAILDAAAKYLGCLGLFYWVLGFLNVCRMTTQGLGYSGRAVFSGIMEMIARIIVSVFFVDTYGFTAICFADQSAWIAACLYIVPMCFYCVKKAEKNTVRKD
ncbi:MAG: MATE family efflux transporter [Oscillospiraceae bacterium]|nr:MATE family efflux transporter [Oscillospiraceae bacterium]